MFCRNLSLFLLLSAMRSQKNSVLALDQARSQDLSPLPLLNDEKLKKTGEGYEGSSIMICLAHFQASPESTEGLSWNRIEKSHMHEIDKERKFFFLFQLYNRTRYPQTLNFLNQYQFINEFDPRLKLFIYVNELERK